MGEGLGAYLKELQKVSGAQEVGSRPGIEGLLQHGGVWRLGVVALGTKTQDKATLFRTLEPASLSLFFPLGHPVTILFSEAHQAQQGRCSKTGLYNLL